MVGVTMGKRRGVDGKGRGYARERNSGKIVTDMAWVGKSRLDSGGLEGLDVIGRGEVVYL